MKHIISVILIITLIAACTDQSANDTQPSIVIIPSTVTTNVTTLGIADITNMISCQFLGDHISVGKDMRGNTVTIDGVSYYDVIGMTPVSNKINGIITCKLNGNYSVFKSKLYLNNKKSTVNVSAYLDNQQVFTSGKYNGMMEPKEIELDLTGADVLKFHISPYGYCSNDMVILLSPEIQ